LDSTIGSDACWDEGLLMVEAIGNTEVANSKKLRSEEQKLTKNAPFGAFF
jgi:hypothetical protein